MLTETQQLRGITNASKALSDIGLTLLNVSITAEYVRKQKNNPVQHVLHRHVAPAVDSCSPARAEETSRKRGNSGVSDGRNGHREHYSPRFKVAVLEPLKVSSAPLARLHRAGGCEVSERGG